MHTTMTMATTTMCMSRSRPVRTATGIVMSRSGMCIRTYRMRILKASPDRIVFDMENVNTMKYLFVTLFSPGEMQSIYFLDRESDDTWRYFSISRTGKKASNLTAGHEASSINRAVAYYRYLTGIPTDKEPPAAR